MKNFEFLASVNGGLLTLKTSGLSSNPTWRGFQLRKASIANYEKYQTELKELPKEAGIEDGAAMEIRRQLLIKIENPSEDEKKELDEIIVKLNRYNELFIALLNEDVDFSTLKPMKHEDWCELVKLNTDENGKSPFGFNMFYIFDQPSNNVDVESAFKDIAWHAPEETE